MDGIFGGEEFFTDKGPAGYSVPGIFGGHDYYDEEGKHAGYGVDSITGMGETIHLNDDPFGPDPSDGFDSFPDFGPDE